MASKIKSLGYEMRKVIDLGLIDSWLRGLVELVPRALHTSASSPASEDTFNTHMISYDCVGLIKAEHISGLSGLHNLLEGCVAANVAVEIDFFNSEHLRVFFKPECQFKDTEVFKARFSNVVPHAFGRNPKKPQGGR